MQVANSYNFNPVFIDNLIRKEYTLAILGPDNCLSPYCKLLVEFYVLMPPQRKAMKYLLGKASTMFVVSGLVKIAAGIVICLWPISDFTPLIYLFGLPAIIQGIVHLTSAAQYRSRYEDWRVLLMQGVIYLAAGAIVVGYPGVTPGFLMVAIAVAWLLSGIVNVMMSVQLNKELQKEVGLLLSGILSIMAGIYILTNLNREVYLLLWILVIYGFLIGILNILFGIKARTWHHMYFDDYME